MLIHQSLPFFLVHGCSFLWCSLCQPEDGRSILDISQTSCRSVCVPVSTSPLFTPLSFAHSHHCPLLLYTLSLSSSFCRLPFRVSFFSQNRTILLVLKVAFSGSPIALVSVPSHLWVLRPLIPARSSAQHCCCFPLLLKLQALLTLNTLDHM